MMTENKRFVLKDIGLSSLVYDNGKFIGMKEIVDKLNELAEENKRLRRCINEIYTIARLEEV